MVSACTVSAQPRRLVWRPWRRWRSMDASAWRAALGLPGLAAVMAAVWLVGSSAHPGRWEWVAGIGLVAVGMGWVAWTGGGGA